MLEAIAHAQCKDEKSLKRAFRSNAKKIAKMSNEIPAIFCWHKRFPRIWEVDEIKKFNDLVEDTIAITEELGYLNGAPVNLSISSAIEGDDAELREIGLELFLYIRQRFPLQEILDEGKLLSFLEEISLESKDFLEQKRYDILYFLQYKRRFDNWPGLLFEDNKKQIEKEKLHIAPPQENSEATLQAISIINEEIESGKHTVEDFIQMSAEELFHICDRGRYLKDCKDILVHRLDMLDIEDGHYHWEPLMWYLRETLRNNKHKYDRHQFDYALHILDGRDGSRYLEQEFKNLTNALSVFAK